MQANDPVLRRGTSGDSAIATFTLGAIHGIGGFCAGAILGGVLTLAAASGGTLTGGLLLFVYALGMALPLFLLALSWERIGPWARPRVTFISSAMLIALGALFIVFQGSNALAGVYESLGASDLSAELETALGSALRSSGELVTAGLVLGAIVAVLVAVAWRLRRRPIASRLAAASGASDVARTDAIGWIEPPT